MSHQLWYHGECYEVEGDTREVSELINAITKDAIYPVPPKDAHAKDRATLLTTFFGEEKAEQVIERWIADHLIEDHDH